MADKQTVLLVDDEPITLEVLEATLASAGYEVLKTDRGGKALEIVSEQPVDLVFVDYRMPEMDGLELLGICKRSNLICRSSCSLPLKVSS